MYIFGKILHRSSFAILVISNIFYSLSCFGFPVSFEGEKRDQTDSCCYFAPTNPVNNDLKDGVSMFWFNITAIDNQLQTSENITLEFSSIWTLSKNFQTNGLKCQQHISTNHNLSMSQKSTQSLTKIICSDSVANLLLQTTDLRNSFPPQALNVYYAGKDLCVLSNICGPSTIKPAPGDEPIWIFELVDLGPFGKTSRIILTVIVLTTLFVAIGAIYLNHKKNHPSNDDKLGKNQPPVTFQEGTLLSRATSNRSETQNSSHNTLTRTKSIKSDHDQVYLPATNYNTNFPTGSSTLPMTRNKSMKTLLDSDKYELPHFAVNSSPSTLNRNKSLKNLKSNPNDFPVSSSPYYTLHPPQLNLNRNKSLKTLESQLSHAKEFSTPLLDFSSPQDFTKYSHKSGHKSELSEFQNYQERNSMNYLPNTESSSAVHSNNLSNYAIPRNKSQSSVHQPKIRRVSNPPKF